jgi:uncharacterized protein
VNAEHPNVAGIRRVFDAFGGGDSHALVEVIAPDAVWRVPGDVPVSRTYTGRHDIFELFRLTRRLTGGTYNSVLRWALADDERGVAVYRARGRRGERSLDIDQALLIELREGRWAEILAVPTDPVAFAAFWR